jgi:hypothetical protein
MLVAGSMLALTPWVRAQGSGDLCQQVSPSSFQAATPRLRITIDQGVITRAENLLTGENHTAAGSELRIPRGMGHVTGNVSAAAAVHVPWLASALPPCGPAGCPYEAKMFHHADRRSTMDLTSTTPTGCTATYTGLASGRKVFPKETLQIDLRTGSEGDLLLRAKVTSDASGVFGVMVPLANLRPEHRIYVPSFGGTMFDRSGLAGPFGPRPPDQATLLTLDRPPFWEAPVVAAELGQGSLGVWVEDAGFNPNSFFLSWTGSTFAFGIEQLHLMRPSREDPFPYSEFTGPWWHIGAFDGGWAKAMDPYRRWYAQQFANELARRAAPAWAGDVRVIIDQYVQPCEGPNCDSQCVDGEGNCDAAVYNFIRDQLGDPADGQLHDRVMLFEPSVNCDSFGTNLPRHQPRTQYPKRNRILKSYGFRTMGYVNSYYVNFGSQGFNQYCVLDTGLARAHESFWSISQPAAHDFSNACPAEGPPSQMSCPAEQPPPGCAPPSNPACCGDPNGRCRFGEGMYLDAIKPSWRDLHVHLIADTLAHDGVDGWMKKTEFDAAYEDTAGGTGDFGNGSTLGGTLLFQEIQAGMEARNFRYPMATEWAPNTIAFASRWPLRANHMSGDEKFRAWLMSHQRPVSTFLFGPEHVPWTFTVYAMNNLHRHAVAAYADGLGGLAQTMAMRFSYRADRGDLGHSWYRARLFAQRGLKPTFDLARGPDTLASLFVDRDGGRYEYHATPQEQTLRDPAGAPLYSRITGVTRKTTGSNLALLGWPADSGSEVIGLNPAARYNLTRVDQAPTSEIRITSLSEGVTVRRYYEAPSHVVLVLEALPGGPATVNVTLHRTVPILRTILNDEPYVPGDPGPGPGGTLYIGLTLPARFVFVKQDGLAVELGDPIGRPSDVGRFIEKETGIDRGGASVAWHEGPVAGMSAFFPGSGENSPHTFDWLVRVPANASTLIARTCEGAAAGAGDGSAGVLYVNGREVARDPQTEPQGQQCEQHIVALEAPVGAYAGREMLISVATDHGLADNNVSDYRWLFRPVIVGNSTEPPK